MDWAYFDLVDGDGDVYTLVDEDGQPLKEGDSVLLFANYEEADQYLRNEDIRGSIR